MTGPARNRPRRSIATVSVSGLLDDKLEAIAQAGFDGVEVFDHDLVASRTSPREVAARCADLGLSIDLFQPVRDVEGVPPELFRAVEHRVRTKLQVMTELGVDTFLVCSHAGRDAVDDPDLSAEQLHRVGDLAAEHGVRLAFEALAWGTHVGRVAQAWDVVRRADHPAVTLAVDTFHMLARGDGAEALGDVPGDRIGFLQIADAPVLDMNVLEWSRHHRCFPGQGALDVEEVVAAVLTSGYAGPLSLEVFSDTVREVEPSRTARAAMRSLLYLEDRLARRPEPVRRARAVPSPPDRLDLAFVEVAGAGDLLARLGFARVGRHRTKPVEWWRAGGAHVVVNREPASSATVSVGLATPSVGAIADRAEALLWPRVVTPSAADEAPLPGIAAPSGLHLFLSGPPGSSDDWHHDFEPDPSAYVGDDRVLGIDHVGVAVDADDLDEEVGFLRTVLDLRPGPVEEFMEPHGRLRSRALRPPEGGLRLVLNAETGAAHDMGVNQVALACTDVAAVVRRFREADVAMMPVPDNYYVDLDARFDLAPDLLEHLRSHGLLYDRAGSGELLHAYTRVLPLGFYAEVLERRGGYDAYGSANTHVRLASG